MPTAKNEEKTIQTYAVVFRVYCLIAKLTWVFNSNEMITIFSVFCSPMITDDKKAEESSTMLAFTSLFVLFIMCKAWYQYNEHPRALASLNSPPVYRATIDHRFYRYMFVYCHPLIQ